MLECRYPAFYHSQGALTAEEGLARFHGGGWGGVGRQVILELCLEDDSSPEWGEGFQDEGLGRVKV